MGTYLNRTPSSAGNEKTWTVSLWVKRASITSTSAQFLFASDTNYSDYVYCRFCGTESTGKEDELQVVLAEPNGRTANVTTNRKFRDPSSWYHIVVRCDTTQSTSTDRLRVYVNGSQETSLRDNSQLNQNDDNMNWNSNVPQVIGAQLSSGTSERFQNGYITNFVNIDGQSLAPTSFGETDSTTGEWKPKVNLSGLTFGTNGFWQKYESAGNLGIDSSGNSNTYTVNNAGTNAKTIDTASNNFCTMNPLANKYPNSTFTLGNLAVAMGSSQATFNTGTFGVSSGKWYFEMKPTALGSGTDNCLVGIVSRSDSTGTSDYLGEPTSVVYRNNGNYKKDSGNATYGASWNTSDIVMVAVDCDNNNIYFGTNNQWADGSGNNDESSPTSAITFTSTMISDGIVFPTFGDLSTNSPEPAGQFNFGNPPFTISSGNADANGLGNFEYAPPSGYYALCTKNINSYG
tara:strand:- start:1723 stop:3099 length:1377 start_codon:yes stop_codon:yes gene_type:complete